MSLPCSITKMEKSNISELVSTEKSMGVSTVKATDE
jgi:hypothetical protein